MANSLKKRGQKILKKFSKASLKTSEKSKEHIKENLIERIPQMGNVRLLIFEWGLLVIALVMLSIAQAFWFGDSYAENVYTKGGTYTEATIGEVNSMNPLFATTNSEKVLSKLMFSTLSTVDRSGNLNAGLAESIRTDQEGKVWILKLREGLKWSDGEPITNEDVIFTTELIKNPAVNSIYSSNLANVKVSENENKEIIFELPVVYADFISALNFPIVPKHILGEADPKTLIENSFSNSPVTSGAFSFNAIQSTSSNKDVVIYLSSNPNYYKGKTLLSSFAIHTYPDKESIIRAVNSGLVTATAELTGVDNDKINSGQFYQKISSLNSGAFIFFNTRSETVKNPEIRKAIRQGINLENIREKAPETLSLNFPILENQIKLTNYPILPTYDAEAAKTRLKEIIGENSLNVEVATVNSGYLPNVANQVAEELKNLGINVNVSTYEENQDFINNIISKRSYDILIYEVELGADPDLLPYFHSSQATAAGLNLSNYNNVLVDDLLLGARDTLDESLRIKKYERFLEYFVTETPAIGLYQPNLVYYYNKNVRTFGDNIKLITAIDRFSDITEWAVNKETKNKTP